MAQFGVIYRGDVGREFTFPITKSSATTIASARLMVTPAGQSTSIEWTVSIAEQTATQITLLHTLEEASIPSSGTYRWRAFFYDEGDAEFDSTAETTIVVRALGVARPS
jgi:hypothetical protein